MRPWPTRSPQPMHHVTAAGKIDCLEPVFVLALSRSTICPESVHRSSRSSLCPDFVLSGVAINMMNPDPMFVQLLSGCRVSRWRMKKMRSRDCPKFVFWMEGENEVKNWTKTRFGEGIFWTLSGYEDNSRTKTGPCWTLIRQTLDKDKHKPEVRQILDRGWTNSGHET